MQGYNTIYDTHSIQIQGGYLLLFHGEYNVKENFISKFATNISLMIFHLSHMLNKSKNIK